MIGRMLNHQNIYVSKVPIPIKRTKETSLYLKLAPACILKKIYKKIDTDIKPYAIAYLKIKLWTRSGAKSPGLKVFSKPSPRPKNGYNII
jgi:hypothetical protein